jgi:hypothetical protein
MIDNKPINVISWKRLCENCSIGALLLSLTTAAHTYCETLKRDAVPGLAEALTPEELSVLRRALAR